MANISYPQFGNVKTITLPIATGDNLTLDEYKEKYGIDLRPYIKLNTEDKEIQLNFDGFVLVRLMKSPGDAIFVSTVFAPNSFKVRLWNEGHNSASLSLTLKDADGNWDDGIKFEILSTSTFELDSIRVTFQEI